MIVFLAVAIHTPWTSSIVEYVYGQSRGRGADVIAALFVKKLHHELVHWATAEARVWARAAGLLSADASQPARSSK